MSKLAMKLKGNYYFLINSCMVQSRSLILLVYGLFPKCDTKLKENICVKPLSKAYIAFRQLQLCHPAATTVPIQLPNLPHFLPILWVETCSTLLCRMYSVGRLAHVRNNNQFHVLKLLYLEVGIHLTHVAVSHTGDTSHSYCYISQWGYI